MSAPATSEVEQNNAPIPDEYVDWFVAFLRGGETDGARA